MSHIVTIDNLLQDNSLQRKLIPEGPNCLMRAISDSFYFSTHQYENIEEQLVNFLKKLISTNQVPSSLGILETNLALQQDYCSHPSFIGFDKINLELVSLMYCVKLNIYQISEDHWLSAKIVNKNYPKTIELYKNQNHYDTVYSKSFLEHVTDVQQIIYEILNTAIQHNCKIPKQFKNIEQELWNQEKISLKIGNLKSNRDKIRSLSDQLLDEEENTEPLYDTHDKSQNPKRGQIDMEYAKNQILKHQDDQQNLISVGKTSVGKTSVGKTSAGKPSVKFEITEEMLEQQQQDQIKNIRGNPPGIQGPRTGNQTNQPETSVKKAVVIDEGEQRFLGRLKFFDESKNYGFIVLDQDNTDIFVHVDDLQKVGITKEFLRGGSGSQYKSQTGVRHFGKGPGQAPRFSFAIMVYLGKYNKSRKAVDLKLLVE